MINIADNYYRRVTVWLTKEQSDKIEESDMSDSEYIREAIDEKDVSFKEIKHRLENYLVDDMIKYLSDKKTKDVRQSVRQNSSSEDENVRQIYSEIMNVRQNEENLSDNKEENVRQTLESIFGESLQTIVNLLHAQGKLSPSQYSVISGKLGLKTKELRQYVNEYHDELMKMVPLRC